ncbi:MAG TPA: HEAT repeat domain-containing protein [Anaeromyxobacteraceae bacterium]|nr:HEAT repeat domain-containing protein [Anaeromyxobacteraceae bacterium]
MSGNPEALLRGALEKIVYFECRLSQLEAELSAARDVASREKESAAGARAREASAVAELARARTDLETARRAEQELGDRVRLLEAERERFLAGLIDQARIAGAASEGQAAGEEADLAGFIAELRAEIDRLRPWKAAAEAAGLRPADAVGAAAAPSGPARVDDLARSFQEAGRIGLGEAESAKLRATLPSRAERSLFESSMDDLASADRHARRRAADALRAMGSRASAPLVAAAIGRERDEEVKVALLAALGALGEPAAADVAARELADARPAVRAAALDAVAALAGEGAEPRILAAFADASAIVRRRAVLLLGLVRGEAAEEALRAALADRDPGVARSAAVALSGRPTPSAQAALARALDHAEESVRRVAASAVARWSGETVPAAAPAEDRRRAARRIAEKLSAIGAGALRDAVVADPAAAPRAASRTPVRTETVRAPEAPVAARAAAPAPPATTPAAPRAAPAPSASATAVLARAAVAVIDAPPGDLSPLEEAALLELRSALRGRTPEEVARVVPGGDRALDSLVVRGAAVRRGARYFPA